MFTSCFTSCLLLVSIVQNDLFMSATWYWDWQLCTCVVLGKWTLISSPYLLEIQSRRLIVPMQGENICCLLSSWWNSTMMFSVLTAGRWDHSLTPIFHPDYPMTLFSLQDFPNCYSILFAALLILIIFPSMPSVSFVNSHSLISCSSVL